MDGFSNNKSIYIIIIYLQLLVDECAYPLFSKKKKLTTDVNGLKLIFIFRERSASNVKRCIITSFLMIFYPFQMSRYMSLCDLMSIQKFSSVSLNHFLRFQCNVNLVAIETLCDESMLNTDRRSKVLS